MYSFSLKRPVLHEISPASTPKLFSRAASSAASSEWWALVWASLSSPRWPYKSAKPAVTFGLLTARPCEPLALSFSADVRSPAFTWRFFRVCATGSPEYYRPGLPFSRPNRLQVIFGRYHGAAGEIRTLDLVLRRHALYPSELQPHGFFYTTVSIGTSCLPIGTRGTPKTVS